MRVAIVCLLSLSLSSTLPAPRARAADTGYTPAPQNLEARRWFQDARFGLFVHWGVYSALADGEWVMNTRKIRASEYEQLPPLFNPIGFNAAEWVALAKAAGMKYITITSKHHDGFAMYGSKVSDWNIVARTPWKRDPLKELADECRKQGLKLFFYYSQLDWHHPDYFPRGRTGHDTARPDRGEWPRYIDFMAAQLTELLTKYGPVAGIWFDGWWDRKDADWRLDHTYALIHKLQPAALIGSNHHRKPFPGEDFQMFEKDLPGHNTTGFSGDSVIGDLPLETCETINGAWGYNLTDRRWKSARELVQYLARAASKNANLLLNVGPMPNGKIQPEAVERLRAIGAWLKTYGASIYGTQGGPVPARPWGVTTRKGNTVYLHLFDWPEAHFTLPDLGGKALAARSLKTGAALEVQATPAGAVIAVPPAIRDPYDTVIAVELAPN